MGPTTMSTMNSKLVTVEKLTNNGENWIMWKSHLLSILEANALLKHIEGSACCPADPDTFPIGYTISCTVSCCFVPFCTK
jgi:hypothetical protein